MLDYRRLQVSQGHSREEWWILIDQFIHSTLYASNTGSCQNCERKICNPWLHGVFCLVGHININRINHTTKCINTKLRSVPARKSTEFCEMDDRRTGSVGGQGKVARGRPHWAEPALSRQTEQQDVEGAARGGNGCVPGSRRQSRKKKWPQVKLGRSAEPALPSLKATLEIVASILKAMEGFKEKARWLCLCVSHYSVSDERWVGDIIRKLFGWVTMIVWFWMSMKEKVLDRRHHHLGDKVDMTKW